MPDPKKTVKAPVTKFSGAKQVLSKKDIPASYIPAGKEGKREYFTETVEAPPAITPKPGKIYPGDVDDKKPDPKAHEGFLIKQLQSGVTPEDLVKKGHATPEGIDKLKSFYQQKHLYIEPTETKANISAVGTGIQGSQIQNFANPQYDVKTLPDFQSGGSWNKGQDVYVEKGTGKIVDLTKNKFEGQYYNGVKQGAFEPGYTGKTWDELNKSGGGTSKSISNQLGVTTTGDVKTADVIDVDKNVGTYMNTLGAGQGNAFQPTPINMQKTNIIPPSKAPIVEQYKKGGLVSKLKCYQNGGEINDPNNISENPMTGKPINQNGRPLYFNESTNDPNKVNTYYDDVNATTKHGFSLGSGVGTGVSMPMFKKGGLVSKIKGYAEGGETSDNSAQVAGLIGMGAGIAGQYGSQAIDKQTMDEQGRYKRRTYENDPTNGNLSKVLNKGTLSGGIEGAGKGAAMGAAFGPVGVGIGAGAGLLFGVAKGTMQANKDAKSIDMDKWQAEQQKLQDAQALRNASFQNQLSKQLTDRSMGYKDGGFIDETAALQKRTIPPKPLMIKAPKSVNKSTVEIDKKGLEEQKKKLGYKDGGKIEGKGTGTSDSITATIKSGSFIVPSKNSDKAEAIRKVILKTPITKANLNQSGGEKVKLSNGEHSFTSKEVEKIENVLGDDALDKLAPNSAKAEDISEGEMNEKEGYKDGGNLANELKSGNKKVSVKKSTPTYYSKNPTQKEKLIAERLISQTPNLITENQQKLYMGQPVESNDLYKGRTPEEMMVQAVPTTTSNKGGLAGKFSMANVGKAIEMGIPLAQIGFGLNQLRKQGKRPVDILDKEYLNSIQTATQNRDIANANAKYGFTPEEQTLINQQNASLTNAQRFDARNISGGSSANAYNMERGAINESFGRGLKAAVENRNLMLQKQGLAGDKQAYLDSLIGNKTEMSRRLFNDKMNAFNVNQQAGAGLVGAGIENLVGNSRYNAELDAMKNSANFVNSWMQNIGK